MFALFFVSPRAKTLGNSFCPPHGLAVFDERYSPPLVPRCSLLLFVLFSPFDLLPFTVPFVLLSVIVLFPAYRTACGHSHQLPHQLYRWLAVPLCVCPPDLPFRTTLACCSRERHRGVWSAYSPEIWCACAVIFVATRRMPQATASPTPLSA